VDTNRELYNSVLQRMKDLGLAAEASRRTPSLLTTRRCRAFSRDLIGRWQSCRRFAFGLAPLGIGLAFLIEYQDKTLKNS